MGTPNFAVPSLQALYGAGHNIVGVFTQPDRPAGRGKKVTASPIKVLAENLNLPVFQPLKIKAVETVDLLKQLKPECIIVVAYGQILSKEILELPAYGCINLHASLLPAYRGAAPIHWAVIYGESKTGVTTMLMDEGLDTGDMLMTREYRISSSAHTGEVHDALAKIGAEVLLETIKGLKEGTVRPIPQPPEFTYAPLLKREHEKIDWSWSASIIHNRIRGLNPWPGAFAHFRGERVKIWQSKLSVQGKDQHGAESIPGQIVLLTEHGFKVQTGEGFLEITELQPAGKKKMSASDFFNGWRIKIGESFE
jgi:methionyl-tRNA formyltransferase